MISPAGIYPLKTSGMSGGFSLGVELPFNLKAARFAEALARWLYVGIFWSKSVTSRAVSFTPAHGKHGLSSHLNAGRPKFLLENFFGWASFVIAAHKRSSGYVQFSRPFRKRERFAVKGYTKIISAVVSLHKRIGPATIRRLVISVGVNPIQRFAVFGKTHIVQKVFKCLPMLTDHNAATTIVFIAGSFGSCAAHEHPAPNSVGSDTGENFNLIHAPKLTHLMGCRQYQRSAK